jgi:fido (protein-threonine AMPylation protein)
MPLCAPWNSDDPADLLAIEDRLRTVLVDVAVTATKRDLPTVGMAQEWHRTVYEGLHISVPYYAGEVRDSDSRFPCLIDYEVDVGGLPALRAARVPVELSSFETSLRLAVSRLDGAIPAGRTASSPEELWAVIQLCALAHGGWVRIHPFANGNGRVARLWANWCALRYGLPPFVRLHPRPDHRRYARASARSMQGEHEDAARVFLDLLLRIPRTRP